MDSSTQDSASNSKRRMFPKRLFKGVLVLGLLGSIGLAWSRAQIKTQPPIREADGLPFYNSEDFTPHWIPNNDPVLKTFHKVGAFSLTDQQGRKVTETALKNKVAVVNFFFPACHGVCPLTMKHLSKVQTAYNQDKNVVVLSFSLTQDPPTELAEYAEHHNFHGKNWHFLAGDLQKVYAFARSSFFADEDLGKKPQAKDFLHTENFFLVDTKGHIRGLYSGSLPRDVEQLVQDVKTLEKES